MFCILVGRVANPPLKYIMKRYEFVMQSMMSDFFIKCRDFTIPTQCVCEQCEKYECFSREFQCGVSGLHLFSRWINDVHLGSGMPFSRCLCFRFRYRCRASFTFPHCANFTSDARVQMFYPAMSM